MTDQDDNDSWSLLEEGNNNSGSDASNCEFEVVSSSELETMNKPLQETPTTLHIKSGCAIPPKSSDTFEEHVVADRGSAPGLQNMKEEPEEFLIFTCVGPPEADFYQKNFQVKKATGCIGGRKQLPHDTEFVKFTDTTVSRRHFEIFHCVDRSTNTAAFRIQDLGTAGGTYIRIPHGERKQLLPGTMLSMGKHQFIVSSVLVEDPPNKSRISQVSLSIDCDCLSTEVANSGVPANTKPRPPRNECTLTCFAPTGSPLIGVSYTIPSGGATIGRRSTSTTVRLCHKIMMPSGEERVVNVDPAISSEHARVEFEPSTGQFFICDGTSAKASTNGTWYRLSGPDQASAPHILHAGMQVLFGNLKFEVTQGTVDSGAHVSTQTQTWATKYTVYPHSPTDSVITSTPAL